MSTYLVADCGRVGSGLATALALQGHKVIVIDTDPRRFRRLGPGFGGQTMTGWPLQREILLKAGIERCDGLAAVFRDDAVNLALAMAARRIFRVPQVVARLDQPRLADICHRMGILTLCPQRWGVNRMMQLLLRSPLEVVASLASQLDLVEVSVPATLAGRTPEDLQIPQEIQVVLISRKGKAIMLQPGMTLEEGDSVHLMVRDGAVDQLRARLS